MPTYLLTWNPKKWHWWDDLRDSFDKIGSNYYGSWSCGKSKRIGKGDRVFLIRLGKEPRGIVGSGYAESKFYKDDHWDDNQVQAGKSAFYVKIYLDTLLNPAREAIFSRDKLDEGILSKMHWDSQGSGIQIPDDVASKLEEEWAHFLGKGRTPIPIAEPLAIEGLKTETVRYIRGRSRYLRDLVLKESLGICCVCDVDYSRVLDGDGVRVLQVHHRNQLAIDDVPRVTRLQDLAVVCTNCHMLIHINPKSALTIEELRKRFGKPKKAVRITL